jgi:hypothetical protein
MPPLYVSHEDCPNEESKVGAIAVWRQATVSINRSHDWLKRNDEEDNSEVETTREIHLGNRPSQLDQSQPMLRTLTLSI